MTIRAQKNTNEMASVGSENTRSTIAAGQLDWSGTIGVNGPPVIEPMATTAPKASDTVPNSVQTLQRTRPQSICNANSTRAPATAKKTGMRWHSAVAANSTAAQAR